MVTQRPPTSRNPAPRRYVSAGFYFSFGILLLILLALVAHRFAEATLTIIGPFAIGLMIAMLLDPLADNLMKRGLSRMVASGIVFGVFLFLIIGIGYLSIPALIGQAGALAQNGPTYIAGLQDNAQRFLDAHHKIGPFKMPKDVAHLIGPISGQAASYLQKAGGSIGTFLIGSATFLLQLLLTLIITFYFLVDIDRLRARLFYLAPEKWRSMMGHVGSDVGGVFSDYLRGLLIVCALYGVTTIGVLYGLSIFHHSLAQYALLVGAAAGVLFAVPYLGSLTTALVTFIVAYAAAAGDHQSGLAFGGIAVGATLVVNQVFDNVVTPRVVGGGVGLHPILALFALVIGGELFGITGMLLSVPIAGSVQAILFRLYPRLTKPTPAPFLMVQGVPLDNKESTKILQGDTSVTTERQEAEQAQS